MPYLGRRYNISHRRSLPETMSRAVFQAATFVLKPVRPAVLQSVLYEHCDKELRNCACHLQIISSWFRHRVLQQSPPAEAFFHTTCFWICMEILERTHIWVHLNFMTCPWPSSDMIVMLMRMLVEMDNGGNHWQALWIDSRKPQELRLFVSDL